MYPRYAGLSRGRKPRAAALLPPHSKNILGAAVARFRGPVREKIGERGGTEFSAHAGASGEGAHRPSSACEWISTVRVSASPSRPLRPFSITRGSTFAIAPEVPPMFEKSLLSRAAVDHFSRLRRPRSVSVPRGVQLLSGPERWVRRGRGRAAAVAWGSLRRAVCRRRARVWQLRE